MSNLIKAVIFTILAFVACIVGVVADIRQLKKEEQPVSIVPLALFSSSFISAGVGALLFGDYLLGPH